MTLFWIRSRQVRIILPDLTRINLKSSEMNAYVMGVCWVCDECEMVVLCVFCF